MSSQQQNRNQNRLKTPTVSPSDEATTSERPHPRAFVWSHRPLVDPPLKPGETIYNGTKDPDNDPPKEKPQKTPNA